jgi:glycosyltransferase involved in cell wall biosynthesis
LRHIAPESPEEWPALWFDGSKKDALGRAVRNLPRAVQEEFVRCQGPYSSSLLHFLESEKNNYDYFLFFTYLYPTTYYGSQIVPRGKRILVPTLHDEPHARLPLFREMVEEFDRLIFLTPGERTIANRIWQPSVPGELVGMPVEDISQGGMLDAIPEFPYLLYCGRIEGAKGASALFQCFLRYKAEHPSDLKLVLTGHAVQRIPDHPDIIFLGYVDEARKFALMRGATIFVHPSALESFSIVLLEAFLSGTPALVNANSVVLAEHCRAANAGLEYRNYDEFAECLSLLLSNCELRKALGENGRRYVQQNYSSEVITRKLEALLEDRNWESKTQVAKV